MADRKCKNYIIYKFVYAPSGDTFRMREKRWKRAKEFTDFKVNLIDAFAGKSFADINREFLLEGFNKGIPMVTEKRGILFEHHWKSQYIFVPKEDGEAIQFFENNKPTWVKTVKKI